MKYAAGYIYTLRGTKVRIALGREGEGENAVVTAKVMSDGGGYYNFLQRFDEDKFLRNKAHELNMLEDDGHHVVSVIPPPSALENYMKASAFTSGDQDNLFKNISLTMEIMAAKQLNIYKADKLPSEAERKKEFANSYIIVQGEDKKFQMYFIDAKGKEHPLSKEASAKMEAKFIESKMLTRGAKFWSRDMSHLTSATDKTIRGGKVERLNLGVAQLKAIKELVTSDPGMPRETGTNSMIWQGKQGLGGPEDIEAMKKQIHQLAAQRHISLEQADELVRKLDVFKRDVGPGKQLVQSAEDKQQSPVPHQQQEFKGSLGALPDDYVPFATLSSLLPDRATPPVAPVAGTLSSVGADKADEKKEEAKATMIVGAPGAADEKSAPKPAEPAKLLDPVKDEKQKAAMAEVQGKALMADNIMKSAVESKRSDPKPVDQEKLQEGIKLGIVALNKANALIAGTEMNGSVALGGKLDKGSDERQADVLQFITKFVEKLAGYIENVTDGTLQTQYKNQFEGQLKALQETLQKGLNDEVYPEAGKAKEQASSFKTVLDDKLEFEVGSSGPSGPAPHK
jgi:hypothetical protein